MRNQVIGTLAAGVVDDLPGGADCNRTVRPGVTSMRWTGAHAVGAAAPAVEMTGPFLVTGDAPSSFAGAGFAGAVRS